MEINLLVITMIFTIISVIILIFILKKFNELEKNLSVSLTTKLENSIGSILKTEFSKNREETRKVGRENREEQANYQKRFSEELDLKFEKLISNQIGFNRESREQILEIKRDVEKYLEKIRTDNEKQLNNMRRTVDEKLSDTLEKRLGESFKLVSERLEAVHNGLGEMKTIATGVGDLKKVLSNVKTRGILGEYQLGNILEQILSPQQYSTNVATKKGSQANVEYAIKLPGKNSDEEVWLPVDSKFPIENYYKLIEALDSSDQNKINEMQKKLFKSIEQFAKDISSKYIDPPHTTDFAIMFLPIESLYSEVLRNPELFNKLQNNYKVTITGPTTLSALCNSLQMGFKTVAVQKRSSEVWKILSSVKTEFSKFTEHLDKVYKQINTAQNSLDTLRKTRTSAMTRKMKEIETLSYNESERGLKIDN